MSLSLLITINVLAIAALLAGLAYAMSRTTSLKPHVASGQAAEQSLSAEPALAPQPSWRSTRPTRPGARQPASMTRRAGSHVAAAHES